MSDVSPSHKVEIPVWNKPEPTLKFPERLKKTTPAQRKSPWRVAPDDKCMRTHELAESQESLLAVHPHAVAISSPGSRQRWAVWGLFSVGVVALLSGLYFALSSIFNNLDVSGFIFYVLFVFGCGVVVSWAGRVLFKMPNEWPVLFNRKTRMVYFYRHKFPEFFSMGYAYDPKIDLVSVPWDEVRVRSYKWMGTHGGRSFHDLYGLFLMWGGEDGDPDLVREMVSIGYEGYWEDSRLFQVWEYVRRYMEEDGPAVPPGETLRKPVEGAVPPVPFPPEVIEAAGGPALSAEEVARMGAVVAAAKGGGEEGVDDKGDVT